MRGPAAYGLASQDLLISDFEANSTSIAKVAGRDGYWVWGNTEGTPSQTAALSSDCPADGKYAGHFWGAGYHWDAGSMAGTNWTAIFRSDAAPDGGVSVARAYDARSNGYTGISFWAAFGSDNKVPFQVRFGITTIYNAYKSTQCGRECQHFFAIRVPLTSSWQRYVLRFQDMAKDDSYLAPGEPEKLTDQLDKLVGFIIWPEQDFDLLIDDVRFER